jgi:hypothetical protein
MMNIYRIATWGKGFQVVETDPSGGVAFTGGFHTQAEAQAWIDNQIQALEPSSLRRASSW